MRVRILAFIIGTCLAAFAPWIPRNYLLLITGFTALGLLFRRPVYYHAVGGVIIGSCWALFFGQLQLSHGISDDDIKAEFLVSGVINDLPIHNPGGYSPSTRFSFKLDNSPSSSPQLRVIRLSWYNAPEVQLGERWQLNVKLKPPRSLVNSGSFDYRLWALVNQIDAVGTVVSGKLLAKPSLYSVANLREQWRELVSKSNIHVDIKPLFEALGVGYRHGFTDQHNRVLVATGISHLMVISGLHIGLCAGFGWWLGVLLAQVLHIPILRGWRDYFAGASALLIAATYAAMSGFALPTVRALLMLMVLVLLKLNWRRFYSADVLLFIMFGVVIANPLLVMSASFWLSFTAVAILLLVVIERNNNKAWRNIIVSQFWIFTGLIPILVIAGLPLSIAGFFVNLLAIPFVSLFVVPPMLIVMLVNFFNQVWAKTLLQVIDYPLEQLWHCLTWVESFSELKPIVLSPYPLAYFSAVCGLLILLLKTDIKWRLVGLSLLSTLFFPQIKATTDFMLKLAVLDVGQGLAIAVQTPNYNLVFDTGAKYQSGFSMAEAVLVPYLRRKGIASLDALVISHRDNDHAGGADYLRSNIDVKKVFVPKLTDVKGATDLCKEKVAWVWDSVSFQFLHPAETLAAKSNNQSCVLQIKVGEHTYLLTGDIERVVEHALVKRWGKSLNSPVIIVPHHGSSSSSSPLFLRSVKPKTAIVSAGYLNRFNHPTKAVVDRYERQNATVFNTAELGSIEMFVSAELGASKPALGRAIYSRYWRNFPCDVLAELQQLSAYDQWVYRHRCKL